MNVGLRRNEDSPLEHEALIPLIKIVFSSLKTFGRNSLVSHSLTFISIHGTVVGVHGQAKSAVESY